MFARFGATIVMIALIGLSGCGPEAVDARGEPPATPEETMNRIARAYVRLVLSVGMHDDGYVDAYYGPAEWRENAESRLRSLAQLRQRATELMLRVEAIVDSDDELVQLRRRYLRTQLASVRSHVERLAGRKMTFDEESKALYDAVAPSYSDEHFQSILDELEPLLPGTGPLVQRYEAFKQAFIIPPERLDTVFETAIEACRRRTGQHLDLPEDESFRIEYVNDKSWSAYNWYQGGFNSLIQVNTDLPIYIDRAIDLACHEGYPGHHVYNLLLEKALVRDRGWPEYCVYPLYSPQSLIAEGTANFGIEMAFPGNERLEFEREALFPAAGLDPSQADLYHEVQRKVQKLSYAGNEAARRYLDGDIDADAAVERLTRYALMPRKRAEQRLRFIESYRSYVINYNLGQDLVRRYVESRAGSDPLERWRVFGDLLSSPRLPSGLE